MQGWGPAGLGSCLPWSEGDGLGHCPKRVWWPAHQRGARYSPRGPSSQGSGNIHLTKTLCLTFHIVEAGLPWSCVCACVRTHTCALAACAREMLHVLGLGCGGGHGCLGLSALQGGDGLSLGALAPENPRLVFPQVPSQKKGVKPFQEGGICRHSGA